MSKKTVEKQPIDRVQTLPDQGLSAQQVDERVKKGHVNISIDPNEKSMGKILAGNLFTFFNIVLFTIALIFIGFMIYLSAIGRSDIVDKYFGFSKFVFLIPAIMNVAMGTFQEVKSLQVIKKLKIVTSTKSRVVRDGEIKAVDAEEIVLDDIVAISAGDQATADLIVLTGEVEVDESMLTGEADHIKKREGDTILSGSSIIVGSARCRADKIGDETYAAELTRKVKSTSGHKSELMSSVMRIIKILTIGLCIAVTVCTATLVYKISIHGGDPTVWGNNLTLSLNDPVSWALIVLTDGMFGIGMIPSGLVLTTSVALMVSIAQLTKKQTLVQELYSLENLSRVDVICLDKTGTLTDGTMAVHDVKPYAPMEDVERYARLLMGAAEEKNATAEAIFNHFGADEKVEYKELIPFSSATKCSGVVMTNGKKLLMGAPEYLLPKDDERLSYAVSEAEKGNRVIAFTLDGELVAFIAIEDHIRESAGDTLKFFRENGVTVKVISGDNPITVSKIAQKCGIVNAEKYISLAGVALEDIPAIAEEYTVFARVSPEQKEALVKALQENGHKVAMTGDGVNDILALRRSDSSITFAKATDAAKSCSDVVLLDNDFSHLKEVVGEGRRVIGNIQKTAVLYLVKSTVTFLLAFALIPFAKAQMWFSVENLYMLEAAVIGTGGFLVSLEPRRTPVRGNFLKNIASQAFCAGALAAVAILLPILLNTIPKGLGYAPFIADQNIRPMMTIMLTLAGLTVLFAMCIPFNKYRTLTILAVLGVTTILGLLLPSQFIGGQTMGADMFTFDKAAGQTIFDAQLFQEMFRPMNAPVIRGLLSDDNNFVVLRIFMYVAIPAFILVRFAVENHNRKDYKDLKKGRAFRIGRRLMLTAGFVLILQSALTLLELGSFFLDPDFILFMSFFTWIIVLAVVLAVLQITIGIIGYKVWKDPTKKMIRIGFIAGIVLLLLSIIPMFIYGSPVSGSEPLLLVDNVVSLLIAVSFIIGSFIVRANVSHAVAGKRTS